MSTDYDAIKDSVDTALLAADIEFSVSYVGETQRDDWKCDSWVCLIGKRPNFQRFDYYTGLGHRTKNKIKDFCRPVKPRAADVLQCLISDSGAANQGFSDWCSDLGYDDDSIKALNIYKACEQTHAKLRAVFTREQIEQLRDLTQDL